MRYWVALAAAAALLGATPAFAVCVSTGPLCSEWKNYDEIFDGTVTGIRRIDEIDGHDARGNPRLVGHRLVTFAVHDRWRGAARDTVELFLAGGYDVLYSETSVVEVGVRYVVFAKTWNGRLTTSNCTPTGKYEDAKETLAFLRSLREPPAGATILGRIGVVEGPFGRPGALPVQTTITVTGNGLTRTLAGWSGTSYEVAGLPPGSYVIAATSVPNLTHPDAQPVDLADARSCAVADFYFHHDTTIEGQLVDREGKPRREVAIEVTPLDRIEEAPRGGFELTDESGFFSFEGLPPGDYVLGLNLSDDVSSASYPRTIYSNPDGAPNVITLAGGRHLQLPPWVIGPPLEKVKMRLRVVGPDGSPLRKRNIDLLDVTNPRKPEWAQRVMGSITGDSGHVEFDGKTSRIYVVASLRLSEEKPARSQPFRAEDAVRGVLVTLPAR